MREVNAHRGGRALSPFCLYVLFVEMLNGNVILSDCNMIYRASLILRLN
jgi:hypothetical protein